MPPRQSLAGSGFASLRLIGTSPTDSVPAPAFVTSTYRFGGWSDGARPTLCIKEVDTGLAYRSSYWNDGTNLTAQGSALQLTIETAVGNYEYETNYKFQDNGTITAAVGATGEISPTVWADQVAATSSSPGSYGWPVGPGQKDFGSSHYHSAVWRVDFGIDGLNDQKVAQTDTVWTKKRGAESAILRTDTTPITKESLLNNAKRREWRVYSPGSLNSDGHQRGYKILFGKEDTYEATPALRNAITFTSQKACEQFADRDVDYQCNGQSVIDYANGETLTDPVAWVNVGFHHIVRDEDQSPMPTHWQGFTLTPNDFWAQSPLTPPARTFMNGRVSTSGPSGEMGASTTTTLSMKSTSLTPTQIPTATVRIATTAPRANGVLTFYDGSTQIAEAVTKETDNFTTVVDLPQLDVGQHTLTVNYAGSSVTQPSTSAPVTVTVSPYSSTTTASLAASTVKYGSRGTLNATVTSAVEASGFLVVSNGSQVIATQKLPVGAGGRASILLPAQPRGKVTLTVSYQGVGKVADSTSGSVVLTTQ